MTRSKMFVKMLHATNEREKARYKYTLSIMGKEQQIVNNLLRDVLPTGSGFDFEWKLTVQYKRIRKYDCVPYAIHCYSFLHCMNENGFYDGVIPFTVVLPYNGEHISNDYKLIAHNWKTYTTKKYWPLYLDYVQDTIYSALPSDMEVSK